MTEIFCPLCAKEIKPIEYGNGWLWVCCGKVVHNSSRRNDTKTGQAEGDSETNDSKM